MTFFIVLALLQVIAGTISGPVPRSLPGALSYPRTSNEVPKNASTQLTRKRRCLGTIISLLWPQVVGPVDEGIIAERGFDEIPKTLLEYHLDRIRKKAREEEMNRLAVRAYMQKRLEKMNQVDFPNFHGNRLSFVDLFHRIRYFMGSRINHSKTEVVSNDRIYPGERCKIDDVKLETVEEYVYIGQLRNTWTDQTGLDLIRRNAIIFKSRMPLELKKRAFDQCVLEVVTSGYETWALEKDMRKSLCTEF